VTGVFLKPQHQRMLVVEDDPEAMLRALQNYQPPVRKWS